MLDIQKLERRWLKYKIKTYAPFIIGALVTILLIIVIAHQEDGNLTLKKEQTVPLNNQNTSGLKTSKEESSNVLEPSMEFVQSFQASVPSAAKPMAIVPTNVQSPREAIPTPKVLNIPDSSSLKAPPIASVPLSNDKTISLNRNESKLDIESIERRFKETSNPNLGLFIARYYYDHGNYSDAYNFALKTNSVNNKIDESWIIFSKSLVKLGKVDQAKKTLQLYISESNSNAARSLLDSIEQGTFK